MSKAYISLIMKVGKLDDEIIDKYLKAGKIARKALNLGIELVKPKKKIDLYELCIKIEEYILNNGCRPAFPCNISLNQVAAHSTPYRGDEIEFEKGLLKIDVGAMVDGYIADNAVTIARGYEYVKISEVNKDILDEVIEMIRNDINLGKIGEFVEDRARQYGYKPISNLTGHLVDRYKLHAGKSVPNTKQLLAHRAYAGEVYAIEPFLTFKDGAGSVVEGGEARIFSLTKVKKIKDKDLNKLKNHIFNEYGLLPFTPRWLENLYGEEIFTKIRELYRLGYLRSYPMLVEKKGTFVSQFEHTVIVTDGEPIVITKE